MEDITVVSMSFSSLNIKGIPCPPDDDDKQNGVLTHKVDYTYYVEYDFLPDEMGGGLIQLPGVR